MSTGTDADGPRGVGAHTLRHAATLAEIDLRRNVRKAIESRSSIAVFVLLVLLFVGVGGYGGYRFGRDLGFGADLPLPWPTLDIVRGVFALLWALLAVIVAIRVVGTRGDLANDIGVLSIVPTREAAAGQVLSETVLALTYLLPPFVAVSVGYGVATGEWGLLPTAALAAVGVVAAAVAVAFPIGLAFRHVVTRIGFVARHRTLLFVVVFLAYIVLVSSGAFGNVVAAVFEPMQAAPTGWFADVLLLGTAEIDVDPLRAVAALVGAPLLLIVGIAATTRVADRHWFADPVLTGEEDGDPTTVREDRFRPIEDTLAAVLGRPGAAVTVLAWKRASRAPMKLLYAAYPLLFTVGFIAEIVQTGTIPAPAPAAAVGFVAWAGAVVFTLNPLGDQGAALPTTVLSRVDGRTFVAAHIVAGALLVAPLGAVVVGALAVASPLSMDLAVVVTVAAPVSVLLGSGVAVGLGMAFPRYEAVNVTGSTKAVVPSLLAFLLFSVYLVCTVVAGGIVYEPGLEPLVAALLSFVLPFGLNVSAGAVGTGALAALVPLGLAPFVSTYYAVRRFENVTVS